MSENEYRNMLGRTFCRVENDENERLLFVAADGSWCCFFHSQDCCESVTIDDICGDLEDLVGSPLLVAEEVSGTAPVMEDSPESCTWTFYKFATAKGSVTVRWYGYSNGYYSERVDYVEALPTRDKPWITPYSGQRPTSHGYFGHTFASAEAYIDDVRWHIDECRVEGDAVFGPSNEVLCVRLPVEGDKVTAAIPYRIESFESEAEWLELRKRGIGASEAYAVLTDPARVYCEKRGLVEPFEGNEATEWGNRLEPVVRDKTAEVLGVNLVKPDAVLFSASHPHCLCSLDAVEANEWASGRITTVYEFKTSAMADDWGESGGDTYPERYYLQVQYQMGVTGAKRAVLAVLLSTRHDRFRHYLIERDDAVIDRLMDLAEGLWANHIEPGIPPMPDPQTCALDVVRAITGYAAGKSVVLKPDMADVVLKWHQAKEAAREADKLAKSLQTVIELQMGDASLATVDGVDGLTLKRTQSLRKSYTVAESTTTRLTAKIAEGLLGHKQVKEISHE